MAVQTIATGTLGHQKNIVELSNGWLVVLLYSDSNNRYEGYVSENYGKDWGLLFHLFSSDNDEIAMDSIGTTLFIFHDKNIYSLNSTTHQKGSALSNGFDFFAESNLNSNTLFDYEKSVVTSGNKVYAFGVMSKVVSGTTRYSAYFREGNFSNGGVNWGSKSLIKEDTFISRRNFQIKAINNKPYLFFDYQTNNDGNALCIANPGITDNYANINWGSKLVYIRSPRNNNEFNPSIVIDESGKIMIVAINVIAGNNEILLIESTDNGSNWSAPTVMYNASEVSEAKVTIDRYNDAYIFYRTDTNALKFIKRTDGVWGSEESAWSNVENIALTYDKDFNSTIVGYLWQDVTDGTIKFDYILVNNPPLAPTLKDRPNFDARFDAKLEWIFEDEDVQDMPSAYQLQLIRNGDGATLIDTGKVLPSGSRQTVDEFYTVQANTLSNNQEYSWRVKTWDIYNEEGPYSNYGTFRTSEKPVADVISPIEGYTNDTASITVEWTMSDVLSEPQTAYQVVLTDDDGTVYDSGKVNGATVRSLKIPYSLENYKTYVAKVRVWDQYDVVSDYDTVTFNVDYVRPVVPLVAISNNPSDGSIIIEVTNNDSTNGEPPVDYNDVYRRELGGGSFMRVATKLPLNGTFTDYTPASGQVYEYYVRAWGDNLTFSDSEIAEQSVEFRYAKLSYMLDPSVQFNIKYNTDRTLSYSRSHSLMEFAGRRYPVSEFGESQQLNFDLTFTCLNQSELNAFLDIYERYEAMLYRDYRGRRAFVTADNVTVNDGVVGTYEVSFSPRQVDYHEEV